MNHQGTQPLHTSRLLLRPFQVCDADAMFQNWAKDPEVTTYLRWPPHKDIHTTRAVLQDWVAQYQQPNFYQWAIVLRSQGNQPIGSIGAVDQDEKTAMVHIGYCIGQRWWRQGITSEALAALISYFFEDIQVNRIESMHDPRNIHSGNVMRHCGLRYEGTHRSADWSNQGICDAAMYAILASDHHQTDATQTVAAPE